MDKPKIAGTSPIGIEVEAGKKYAWCTCGLAAEQPFCDGTHKGTEFKPTVFTAEKSETIFFCACKHTEKPYRCDGSHSKLG